MMWLVMKKWTKHLRQRFKLKDAVTRAVGPVQISRPIRPTSQRLSCSLDFLNDEYQLNEGLQSMCNLRHRSSNEDVSSSCERHSSPCSRNSIQGDEGDQFHTPPLVPRRSHMISTTPDGYSDSPSLHHTPGSYRATSALAMWSPDDEPLAHGSLPPVTPPPRRRYLSPERRKRALLEQQGRLRPVEEMQMQAAASKSDVLAENPSQRVEAPENDPESKKDGHNQSFSSDGEDTAVFFIRKSESRNSIHVDVNVVDSLANLEPQPGTDPATAVATCKFTRSRSLRGPKSERRRLIANQPPPPLNESDDDEDEGKESDDSAIHSSPPPLPPRKSRRIPLLTPEDRNTSKRASIQSQTASESGNSDEGVVMTSSSPIPPPKQEPSPQPPELPPSPPPLPPPDVSSEEESVADNLMSLIVNQVVTEAAISPELPSDSSTTSSDSSDVPTDCYNVYNVRTGKITTMVHKPPTASVAQPVLLRKTAKSPNRLITPTINKTIRTVKPRTTDPVVALKYKHTTSTDDLYLQRRLERHSRCTKCVVAVNTRTS